MFVEGLSDLPGHGLLDLESMREAVDYAGETREGREEALGQIGDMCNTMEGEQVVRAHAMEGHVLEEHHAGCRGTLGDGVGALQYLRRILLVAVEKGLNPGSGNELGCFLEVGALDLEPRGSKERADSTLHRGDVEAGRRGPRPTRLFHWAHRGSWRSKPLPGRRRRCRRSRRGAFRQGR